LNGEPCVIFAVMKQSGANTVTVVQEVRDTLERMKEEFPGEITFAPVMDQAEYIEQALGQTLRAAVEGGVLAILLVLVFLRNWRPTLTIFLAIPLSVIATFIGLWAAGYTLNMFTIAGFALGVGLLVDNAVVVIENTFRHLEAGKSRKESAVHGASEVGLAITASTFTTMAVFLPMVIVAGMASQLARPLALTVCISLLASLLVALTIVPMLTATIFKKRRAQGADSEGGLFLAFQRAYERLLVFAVNRKILVIGTALVLFAASLVALAHKGMEMMPEMDNPMTIFSVELPPGTRFDETDQLIRYIEDYERSLPEVRFVISMVGPSEQSGRSAASGFGAADVNAGMAFSRLLEKEDRVRSSQEINDLLRARIPDIEGVTATFMDMGFGSMGTGADQTPVAIRIFGNDIPALREYGQRVLEVVKNVEGIRDPDISLKVSKPELHIRINREKAARFGLSAAQVGSLIETCFKGKLATLFRAQGEEVNITVRFEEEDRDSIEKLSSLSVMTPAGTTIRLGQVVEFDYATGPLSIARESQHRKVTVTASIHGRPHSEVIADIKKGLEPLERELRKEQGGYFVDYGGTYKTMQETFISLFQALIAAIVLVYMIMAAQFESLSQPFIIMFTVPLAIIGVVFGLSVMGMNFSTPAFMGLVILMGIIVNNGIVMVDFINRLRAGGMGIRNAVVRGASIRLRPILITSLTTILGMLPMGLARTTGSEMRGPIGIAIAFGLLFGMALTLIVIPCAYIVVVRAADRTVAIVSRILYGKE
jgi:HAE1 family hydrophobic/amphiphilic exporter-1